MAPDAGAAASSRCSGAARRVPPSRSLHVAPGLRGEAWLAPALTPRRLPCAFAPRPATASCPCDLAPLAVPPHHTNPCLVAPAAPQTRPIPRAEKEGARVHQPGGGQGHSRSGPLTGGGPRGGDLSSVPAGPVARVGARVSELGLIN